MSKKGTTMKPSEEAWELYMTIQKIPDSPNPDRNRLRASAKEKAEALARELEAMEAYPEE